jgi:hypothetical protein
MYGTLRYLRASTASPQTWNPRGPPVRDGKRGGRGQATMTDELTALIEEVLQQWDGPLPRLAYLTDAGESESKFYRQVLKKLRHPRTGKRLAWQWIVDFYHAAQRLTTMGEALFGAGREAAAWAARMRKLLQKPNGPFRVLHAAAAMKGRVGMTAARRKLFSAGVQLSPQAHRTPAVRRVPPPGPADRQRDNRSRLQDRLHPAAEALRHALERPGRSDHPQPPRPAPQRTLGQSL